jgi:deoxyribodipyrimidine photo-lyase
LGETVSAAAHLRPRIHKLFAEAWQHRAASEPELPRVTRTKIDPPFSPWNAKQDIAKFVASLPLDQSVPPVPGVEGGSAAGCALLDAFVSRKLRDYAEGRNQPNAPEQTAASALSAHLHFGHIGIEEVVEATLGKKWTAKQINPKTRNKDDFFCRDPNVNSFLDEAITWRDVGYHWHWRRIADCGLRIAESKNVSWQPSAGSSNPQSAIRNPRFNFETMDFSPGGENTLDVVLPEWARATLRKHERDRREHLYTLEEFEAAATHDELWNAAQRELVATGRIHNYMRMLWGKKVVEWSETPAEAYRVLEHLNNKYALDGRDPNSYTGILWCFGMFDRPWPPERKVFGTVRYMSSENTARKFDLGGYYDYVQGLST